MPPQSLGAVLGRAQEDADPTPSPPSRRGVPRSIFILPPTRRVARAGPPLRPIGEKESTHEVARPGDRKNTGQKSASRAQVSQKGAITSGAR